MTADETTLRALTQKERLAFGAVMHAVIAVDGSYSPEEHDILADLARRLGEKDFWAALEQAGETVEDAAHAKRLAEGVTREVAREVIFYAAYEASQADTISSAEMDLLEQLAQMWNLEFGPAEPQG